MKYSLKQIKKYVPEVSSKSLEDITEKVWNVVSEIESIENLEKKFEGIILSKVLSVDEHPSSKKLVIVRVDVGKDSPITVVTAAKNLSVNDWVPYIPVGSTVPAFVDKEGNPIVIGKREMAGVMSEGMLASEKELGISDNHEGIMIIYENEVRSDLVAGANIAPYIEADDLVFEIENKSLTNRGDLFSAAGLAREIAAIYDLEFVEPEWQTSSFTNSVKMGDLFDKEFDSLLNIEVEAQDEVERYSAVILDGIQVRKSPLWLRAVLEKHGIQSVNNVVDITNYVLLDYGQPMHAFDAAKLSHDKRSEKLRYTIKVRNAKSGEKLVTLDGKEKILPDTSIVIADKSDAIAVAGIIGGENSGIKSTTTRIVLESAVFNKYSIRNTSMKLGINTDASAIFSRKQDPEKAGKALLRAIHLLQELAGGMIVSPVADEYLQKAKPRIIVISHEKLEKFVGIAISQAFVKSKLTRLGFTVESKKDMYKISVPTWRPDVEIDEDVYEEISRYVGYNTIAPELPKRGIYGVSFDDSEEFRQKTISSLIGIGLVQSMNFSFVSRSIYERLNISTDDFRAVVNAISPDVQFVRKQVLPELFSQTIKNQYNRDTFSLFEIGKVSRKSESYTSISNIPAHLPEPTFAVDEVGLPIEDQHLAITVASNQAQPGFFFAKSLLEKYLIKMGIENYEFFHIQDISKKDQKNLPIWINELQSMFRLGRTAVVYVHEIPVGLVGEPSILVKRDFSVTKEVGLVEISMSAIQSYIDTEPKYVEPSKYPTITEDFCFAFSKEIPDYSQVKDVYSSIISKYKDTIGFRLTPIDIYAKDKKIVQFTHRVEFESRVDKDLDPNDIKTIRDDLVDAMKVVGGKLI